MDLSPLRRRDFRLLYIGQFVSFFGSMMSYVALPFVLYQATRSTLWTGALGAVQLAPAVIGGLAGGALADAVDRRKLIVLCELGMAAIVLALGLALTRLAPLYPDPLWILAAAAALSVLNGFHRPALEALSPRLVEPHEMPALGVLSSLRGNVGMIGGPAVAGILISTGGADLAFYLDFLTFTVCIGCLLAIRHVPKVEAAARFSLASVHEGFRYAMGRPDLIGTYVVDIIAMTFSMPNLLFPAVADAFGSTAYLGWLHSGISLGALCATLTSRYFVGTRRHGLMILLAAGGWSVCMVGFGLARTFPVAMIFLMLAGYADMVSAVFRQTIWNQTIPDALRGRLAGIEMISYLSGPMLGNTQLGVLSNALGIQRAITVSSLLGLAGVVACARALPGFRNYLAPELAHASKVEGSADEAA
ncbi:MAG: Enterobactin exporter EntS [Myxococcaceae bacterium]|nr:Enterobactin exporter EntS [Myxococcaceae bacterium]